MSDDTEWTIIGNAALGVWAAFNRKNWAKPANENGALPEVGGTATPRRIRIGGDNRTDAIIVRKREEPHDETE